MSRFFMVHYVECFEHQHMTDYSANAVCTTIVFECSPELL